MSTTDPSHDVIVTTNADDQVAISVNRPEKSALDLALEYAQRVRGDAAIWGTVHDGCAVVVPARSISHIEIVERPAAHAPTHAAPEEPDAAAASAPDAPPFDPGPSPIVAAGGPTSPATQPDQQESAPAA